MVTVFTKYVFDLDGTLCTTHPGGYENAQPVWDRIRKVNSLHDAGHTIIIFTARGMATFRGVSPLAYIRWYWSTRKQLRAWGVKFHRLRLGKPSGDFYIDDKGVNSESFFAGG